MTIRPARYPARYEDIDAIIEMGLRMHAESAYSFLPFEREKVRRTVVSFLEDTANQCGLVADNAGCLVGMLGGHTGDYFFCDTLVAYDAVFYVEPDYRGSTVAPRLIRAFREWAISRGAAEVCLGISTNVNAARTGKFYERLGFQQVGSIYKQRLK